MKLTETMKAVLAITCASKRRPVLRQDADGQTWRLYVELDWMPPSKFHRAREFAQS